MQEGLREPGLGTAGDSAGMYPGNVPSVVQLHGLPANTAKD